MGLKKKIKKRLGNDLKPLKYTSLGIENSKKCVASRKGLSGKIFLKIPKNRSDIPRKYVYTGLTFQNLLISLDTGMFLFF